LGYKHCILPVARYHRQSSSSRF